MISLLEIAQSINEDPRGVDNVDRSKGAEKKDQDADRVGREDGDTWMAPNGDYGGKHNGEIQYFDDEEKAKVYAKSGSEDGKGGEEKPDEPAGKLGGSDFERDAFDASDEPDTGDIPSAGYDDDRDAGRQADFDREYGDDEKNASEKENEKIEDELHGIAKDKGLTVGSEDANHGGEIHSLIGKDDDPDNTLGFHAAPNFDDDGNMTNEPQYAIELGMGSSPMYFGSKEEADSALKKIVDDERIRKAMDGEGGETLFDLGDHAKSVLKGKDETITINGKQYRAIKEENKKSNPRVLKEIYERTFRSLK